MCFTFDFPLFGCSCEQGRMLGKKQHSITTVLWDHSWDWEGRAGQSNRWTRLTQLGKARKAHTRKGHLAPPGEQPLPQPTVAHRGPWSLSQVIDGSRS